MVVAAVGQNEQYVSSIVRASDQLESKTDRVEQSSTPFSNRVQHLVFQALRT